MWPRQDGDVAVGEAEVDQKLISFGRHRNQSHLEFGGEKGEAKQVAMLPSHERLALRCCVGGSLLFVEVGWIGDDGQQAAQTALVYVYD